MKNFNMKLKVIILFFALSFCSLSHAQLTENERTDVMRNKDEFNAFFKEIVLRYVDSIDSESLLQDAMNYVFERVPEVRNRLQLRTGGFG